MSARSLLVLLGWTMACASVSGQESGALHDPMRPYDRAAPGVKPVLEHRVSGTFISRSGRVALVNGKLSREGDRVDGAQILAIDAGAVRIRRGSEELTVYVGSKAPAPSQVPAMARLDAHGRYGPVQRGETLSGIVQRYRADGVTVNQMMVALFETNPRAFGGNINILREGAVLRIPDRDELHRRLPAAAAAEVARQHLDWRDDKPQQQAGLARLPDQGSYGPVNSGETLSGIAERIAPPDGVSMNQMMVALFEANPQAFSGNINILYEGAVLRIPDGDDLRNQSAETAAAEVVRQTDAWRAGSRQQAHLTTRPSRDGVEPGVYDGIELRVAETATQRSR